MQPWHAFKPDGVILFSDILTPLTGMGIPFDIEAGRGPIIHEPIRTMQVCKLFLDLSPPQHSSPEARIRIHACTTTPLAAACLLLCAAAADNMP